MGYASTNKSYIYHIKAKLVYLYYHREINIKLDTDNIGNKFTVIEIFDITPSFFFQVYIFHVKVWQNINFYAQIESQDKFNKFSLILHHVSLK